MGFTYLHEEVEDELRGRTFAALYTVVRTSLLASVTLAGLAVPLLDGLLNPPLDSGLRLTLLAGGIIVFAAGITTLGGADDAATPQAHRDWIQGVARGGRRLPSGQAPHSGRQLMVSMAGEGSAGAEPPGDCSYIAFEGIEGAGKSTVARRNGPGNPSQRG